MTVDFQPPDSAPPRNGDFAAYVDDLVNRGAPSPGAPPRIEHFDPARLFRRWVQAAAANRTGGGRPAAALDALRRAPPFRGVRPASPAGDETRWGRQATAATSSSGPPAAVGATTAEARLRGNPGTPAAAGPAPATRRGLPPSLARLASRMLLWIASAWLVLALVLDVGWFADTVPLAMVMLFASFYLSPGRPRPSA